MTWPHLIVSLLRQLSEGLATQQTLHGLQPFTTYSIGLEACTCFNCCSKGPTAELRTPPAPPSGLSPPQIQTLASRTASFQWNAPLFPNGVILRYCGPQNANKICTQTCSCLDLPKEALLLVL